MAAYICGTAFEGIEPAVIEKTKEVILYHVCQALLSQRDDHSLGSQAIRAARRLSPHGGPATIIGTACKAMPIDAAFANCSQMRAYGLDDVIFPAGIHAGLVTIPAALALAEECGCSGRDVLSAVTLAYEVMGKLGTFTWAASAPRRPTMAYGTFGAVIAAGRVLNLTPDKFAHALGYAAHSAQGLAESELGPVTHYYALVTRAGMTGAVLADEGGIASPTVMEGRFGFFEMFAGGQTLDPGAFIASLGSNYQIMSSIEKRYPGTGLNIIAVELMRDIVRQEKLRPAAVRQVRLLLPQERRNFMSGHSTGPFTNAELNAGSACFKLGMMLLDGDLDFRRYTQFDNHDLLACVAKVKPLLVAGKSNIRWTRLELDLVDGRTITREAQEYSFAPIQPYERLTHAAEGVLTADQRDRFFDLLMTLDKQGTVTSMMDSLIAYDRK